MSLVVRRCRPGIHALAVVLMTVALRLDGWGAIITNVSVGDNFFSPANVQITVGDRVRWVWTGNNIHSTTSTAGLWNSGVRGNGSTFTNLFNAAGTFGYRCTVHGPQVGSVQVQAPPNTPPVVGITAPVNGVVFASPWSGQIQGSASDTDGTVSKVDLYGNTELLGTVNNPGSNFSFDVPGLGAGEYSLKAVATDNGGATNTSSVVAISVVDPAPIVLSNAAREGPGTFRFDYSTVAGLRYVVWKASALGNWSAAQTNQASGPSATFTDATATGSAAFYHVTQAPNP